MDFPGKYQLSRPVRPLENWIPDSLEFLAFTRFFPGKNLEVWRGGNLESKQNPWQIQVNAWVFPGGNLGNRLDHSILGKCWETSDGVKQIAPLERSLFN